MKGPLKRGKASRGIKAWQTAGYEGRASSVEASKRGLPGLFMVWFGQSDCRLVESREYGITAKKLVSAGERSSALWLCCWCCCRAKRRLGRFSSDTRLGIKIVVGRSAASSQ